MAPRKQTPDVLSEVLGGEPTPAPRPARTPRATAPAKRALTEASGRSPTRKAAWEYMEVVFRDYGGYRPRSVNGQEQPTWKRLPVIHEYLNQLGEQGWELAGMGSRESHEVAAYFKKPR